MFQICIFVSAYFGSCRMDSCDWTLILDSAVNNCMIAVDRTQTSSIVGSWMRGDCRFYVTYHMSTISGNVYVLDWSCFLCAVILSDKVVFTKYFGALFFCCWLSPVEKQYVKKSEQESGLPLVLLMIELHKCTWNAWAVWMVRKMSPWVFEDFLDNTVQCTGPKCGATWGDISSIYSILSWQWGCVCWLQLWWLTGMLLKCGYQFVIAHIFFTIWVAFGCIAGNLKFDCLLTIPVLLEASSSCTE